MSALSAAEPAKRAVHVLGRRMAFVEAGDGLPIVFVHGNPTSSYLWRNVWPCCTGHGRCLVPDLIGMGDSDKLEAANSAGYRFTRHRAFFDGWMEAVGVRRDAVLVGHDWGGALAFDWARRHPAAVRGIAYMETIVRPLSWEEWPEASRPLFQVFRQPAGERLILDRNLFVERVLPGSVLRKLSAEEMAVYRRPFAEAGEARRPTLSWPRELPIDGEPADVVAIVQAYADWLAVSRLPKLFVNADPGAILTGDQREFCRRWPNQTEVTVPGSHFIQEDAPHAIGTAIAPWLEQLG